MRDYFIVVLVTAGREIEAKKIANILLKQKLAGCVNIVSAVNSFFWWEGKLDKSCEELLIIKTKFSLLNKLIEQVLKIHSYEVPEIIALPIVGGNKDYLRWIEEVTRK